MTNMDKSTDIQMQMGEAETYLREKRDAFSKIRGALGAPNELI